MSCLSFIATKETYSSYVFVCKKQWSCCRHSCHLIFIQNVGLMVSCSLAICLWVSAPIAVSCMKVGSSSFYSRRMRHWYIFICKAIVHQLPSSLFPLLAAKSVNSFNLQSLGCIAYKIPPTRSVLSKRAVSCLALLTTIDKII